MQVTDKDEAQKRPSGLRWKKIAEEGPANSAQSFRLEQQEKFSVSEGRSVWWSALIDLRDTSIAKFTGSLDEEFADQFHIPSDYDTEERQLSFEDKIIVLFATTQLLKALNKHRERFNIAGIILGAIIDPSFINFDAPAQKSTFPAINVPNGSVITAVIDDGIAFGNDVFRDGLTSTRVHYATVLPAPPGGPASVGGELNKAQIDALLAANTHSGLLDEDRFYQQAGLINYADGTFSPTSLRRSHGTHITGLAAGYPMNAAPDDRPILCAILPTRVTEDVSGGSILPSLILALIRLSRQAARFRCADGTRPPVVFNFSYGNFAGPHDGTSLIARVLEYFFGPTAELSPSETNKQVLRLLLPAGNGNLSRTRSAMQFAGAGHHHAKVLDFVAMPDDRTASEVQLWMPYSGASPLPKFVKVRATTPDGAQSGPVQIAAGSYQALFDEHGHEVARLSFSFAPLPTARGVITLSLNPTKSLRPAPLAPAGRWKIEVTPDEITTDQDIQVWIERDDTYPGFRRGGRQPYFNNADYQRFDAFGAPLAVDPPGSNSLIKRAGTLNGFACGKSPMVIGAHVQSNGKMSDYSAAGPTTPPRDAPLAYRDGPDASATGDDSVVRIGVISAGSRSGSMVRLNGTSVATPRATRFVVDQLATGAAGNRTWIQMQANIQDANYPPPKPEVTRTGGGRLNIAEPFPKF